ncbi:MAG TPA: maleylacetoacetate isomerase [Dongiaceae bacterium]|jgi:maleylpyruvate isomerase|nr:maleylacetoacetate isomerase [Dongiaceae bacterium]
MRLYSYFRSSAAYRVRLALALKKLDAEILPVHLLRGGGEQLGPIYRKLNPLALVPTLETEAGALTQSLAIIEFLEETHPEPALLPRDPIERARVRAFALAIACDIHPLNNLRVLNRLRADFNAGQMAIEAWYCHWILLGLAALEAMVADQAAAKGLCFGEQPGLADICLVPQMANARRYDCDLSAMPKLVAIDAALTKRPEFRAAAPEAQPDYEPPAQ